MDHLPNRAFVFVKPHAAASARVVHFVRESLLEHGIEVRDEGRLTGAEIEENNIVDRHYAAIAEFAVLRDPEDLSLKEAARERFAAAFGLAREDAPVRNAAQFMAATGITAAHLNVLWEKAPFNKIAPGLYMAELEANGAPPAIVINGFYPSLREKLTAPEAQVVWFDAEFSPETLPWRDFRATVIGATNPAQADPLSIRGRLYRQPDAYELPEPPTIQQNGVHASAGPLEAARERLIWRGDDAGPDPFLEALRTHGIPEHTLHAWLDNVPIIVDGREEPVFDVLEDVDTMEALAILLHSDQRPPDP